MQLLAQTLVSRNKYECFFRRATNYVWKDIFFPKQKRFSGTSHFRANFMLVKSFLAKAYLRPFFGYISKMYTPKNELYIGVNASGLYRCFPASQKEYTILFSKSLSPPKRNPNFVSQSVTLWIDWFSRWLGPIGVGKRNPAGSHAWPQPRGPRFRIAEGFVGKPGSGRLVDEKPPFVRLDYLYI